jgi:hypothetical protein
MRTKVLDLLALGGDLNPHGSHLGLTKHAYVPSQAKHL